MKRAAAVLAFVVFATGCASIDKTMQSWVGSTEGDLIAAWGPPQGVYSDGRGGKILAYYGHVAVSVPGYVYGNYYTAPHDGGWDQQRMFYINKDGVIYSWRWKGL